MEPRTRKPQEMAAQRRQAQDLADIIRRQLLPKATEAARQAIREIKAGTIPIIPTAAAEPIPGVMIRTAANYTLWIPYDIHTDDRGRRILADMLERAAAA